MKSVGPSNLYRKLLLYMRWSHRARPIMANQAIKCFPCTKLCKNPPTVSCSLKSSECITHDNLDVYFLKLGLEKLSTITFISSSAISFYDKLCISFWCSLAGHPCSFFFFFFFCCTAFLHGPWSLIPSMNLGSLVLPGHLSYRVGVTWPACTGMFFTAMTDLIYHMSFLTVTPTRMSNPWTLYSTFSFDSISRESFLATTFGLLLWLGFLSSQLKFISS